MDDGRGAPMYAPAGCESERKLQSKLDLPRIVEGEARRSNPSEILVGEVTRSRYGNHAIAAKTRSVKGWMVQDVKEFTPELEVVPVGDTKVLEKGEVKRKKAGSGDLPPSSSQ